MKKVNNSFLRVFFMFILLFCISNSSYAGIFMQNNIGIYYIKDDNQLAKNEWITANDGTGEKQYYFNEFGYFSQVKNVEPIIQNSNLPISNYAVPTNNSNAPTSNTVIPNVNSNNNYSNNQYKMNPVEYSNYLNNKKRTRNHYNGDLSNYYYDYLTNNFHYKLTDEIIYDSDLADYLNSCIDEYVEENKEQLMDDYFSDYIKESLYLHPYDEYCDCYYCLMRRYWYR